MKPKALLFLCFLYTSCEPPTSPCAGAGDFIMELRNEPGEIKWDTLSKKHYLWFSPESRLKFDTKALPCKLDTAYQKDIKIRFDGNFFEGDSDMVVDLRHIEKV